MKVFFAVPDSDVDDICECGLKVSEYKNRSVKISESDFDAVCAYLNPNDYDMPSGYTVIRLVPDDKHFFVAEGVFYKEYLTALQNGSDGYFWKEKYNQSLIPVSEYRFGMYRLPEYLITRTLFSNQIEKFDRRKGEPILYNNSYELYIGNAIKLAEEKCEDFYEVAAVAFFEKKEGLSFIDGKNYKFFIDESGKIKFIAGK